MQNLVPNLNQVSFTKNQLLFLLQLSDWDRYAAEEYELLVAEEGGNEQDSL